MKLAVVLVLFSLSAAIAFKTCVTVYEDGLCQDKDKTVCAESNECVQEDEGSGKIVCTTNEKTSAWTFTLWTDSTTCEGANIEFAATGEECGSTGILSAMVDCSPASTVTLTAALSLIPLLCSVLLL